MKDLPYILWRFLKMVLSAIAICIAIVSSVAWYDTGRFEMILFCITGIVCAASLITSKL